MLGKTTKTLKKAYDYVMWDIIYTAMYGTLGGIGNAIENYQHQGSLLEGIHNDKVYHAFGQVFVNMAVPVGIAVNFAYPIVFDQLSKTKNFRLWANAFNVVVMNGGFLVLHYALGTENPLLTQSLPLLVGTAAINMHVNAIQDAQAAKNDLESRVKKT